MFFACFPVFASFILFVTGAPPTQKPQSGGAEGTDVDIGAIAVSIDPKYPVTTCSDESQAIKCQISDREKRLMKQLRDQHEAMGYHGYVDFLLIREAVKKIGKPETSVDESQDFGNEMIVSESQVTNSRMITEPVQVGGK